MSNIVIPDGGNIGSASDTDAISISSSGAVTLSSDFVPATPLSNRNHLINGDFQVAQRGASFVAGANNDDTYNLDRWYLLSDGNDVVDVTQSSTAPTNQLYSIGLDVETVNKKFGIAQIIENKNCVGLVGNNVTFSFKAKVSATTKLDNIKAGIIAWSSTADAVTSDVVSAWAVEGTNPTLASNLTFENTPANLNVTTSWATYSVSADIDTSSTTNIIVFIWSDVTDTTAGDFLYITDCQLEQGSNATPFEHRSYGDELARCQRYFQARTTKTNTAQLIAYGFNYAAAEIDVNIELVVPMRANPSIVQTSGTNYMSGFDGGATTTFDNFSGVQHYAPKDNNVQRVNMYVGSLSGLTVGRVNMVVLSATGANAFIFGFLAEL